MMTTTFPKYESYKDSGVDWIGAIPAHWGLKKNKFLLTEKKNTVGKNSSNFTLLSLTLQGVIARDMENPQGKFPAEFNTYKIVKPDDLIFCLFDVEETPRTVGHANQTGMITGAYEIFECGSEIDSRYFYYYYLSLDFDKRLQPLYSGLRKVIKIDAFLGTKSPIPSIEEQKRIVEFLDRTTTDIDRAIAQKQRLIELLQEQKAIAINQAVTKGLNPNVPMQDSGIEWLGKIPKYWKVCALSYVAHLTAGGTPDRSKSQYWNGSIPWLKTGEINYNEITTSEEFITNQGLRNSSAKLASPSTILMAMYGQGVTRGRVAILGIEAAFNQACLAITPHSCLQTKYLYYYLQSAYSFVRDFGNETSQMNLSSGSIGKIRILIPSYEEQSLISQFLDQKIVEFNEGISKQEEMIDSLVLLKQTFIAEAVTGKIKV